jgi:DNA repair exonuclease SbcCD ATPase subunit
LKKISKVEVVNFQSHKSTIIDSFGDFNVVLGPTDSGKSAILRAIKWCLYNEPDGTDFIRQGEPYAEVTVYFNDGTAVRRYKSKRENRYELLKDGGSILTLESFGSGPVGVVVDFHGMREVNFFGRNQSLNICDQLSLPFFIANSPIERATMIGQLAKTDVIDRAIKNTAGDMRDKKIEYKSYKGQLAGIGENLKPYENLPCVEFILSNMQEIIDIISENTKNIEHLKEIQSKCAKTSSQIAKTEEIFKHRESVDIAINGLENLIILNTKLSHLNKTNTVLVANLKRKEDLENIIGKVSINDIDNSIHGIESLVEKIRISCNVSALGTRITAQTERVAKVKEKVNALRKTSGDIDNAISAVEIHQATLADYVRMSGKISSLRESFERKRKGEAVISDLKSKYNLAYKAYEEALISSQNCPFCMSEISSERLEAIKDII